MSLLFVVGWRTPVSGNWKVFEAPEFESQDNCEVFDTPDEFDPTILARFRGIRVPR